MLPLSPKLWNGGRKPSRTSPRVKTERRGTGTDVVHDVAVGERNGLGRFFRTGGEEDDGGVLEFFLGKVVSKLLENNLTPSKAVMASNLPMLFRMSSR